MYSSGVIKEAQFSPKIKIYIFLSVTFFLLITIIGIPFLILWLLGIGQYVSRKYYNNLKCNLSKIVKLNCKTYSRNLILCRKVNFKDTNTDQSLHTYITVFQHQHFFTLLVLAHIPRVLFIRYSHTQESNIIPTTKVDTFNNINVEENPRFHIRKCCIMQQFVLVRRQRLSFRE